jgi:FkbM family methyltransferase
MIGSGLLKRWRENPYASAALAAIARPVHGICRELSRQIERKVRKNGATIALPNGRTMRIGRDAGVTMASLLYWNGLGGYEPETSRTLRFFFERAATFVDVGANYGFYSILAALWNPDLRIFSFEPVPQIYKALTDNLALNQVQERVSAHQIALSDRTGTSTFYLPATENRDIESTGTLVPDGWQSRKQSPQITVETARFDDFERSHPMPVDLVKIDVEDFEASVLAGMEQVIRRDRPFIVCEILPREHRNEKTRSLIAALGYTAYWITPCAYVRVSRFDFARGDLQDFLLSPVSLPEEVVTDLAVLWSLRQSATRSGAA